MFRPIWFADELYGWARDANGNGPIVWAGADGTYVNVRLEIISEVPVDTSEFVREVDAVDSEFEALPKR